MNLLQRLRREDGFTLPELLVTMILLGVITGAVAVMMGNASRVLVQTEARNDSLAIATTGMNTLTKTIRAGTEIQVVGAANLPVFAEAGPNSITMYSASDDKPFLVEYLVNANRELIERRYPATNTGPYYTFSATPEERIVARKIPVGEDVFAYESKTGAVSVGNGTTDPAVLSTIEAVEVTLTVQANPLSNTKPTTLTNRVSLPNLGVAKR